MFVILINTCTYYIYPKIKNNYITLFIISIYKIVRIIMAKVYNAFVLVLCFLHKAIYCTDIAWSVAVTLYCGTTGTNKITRKWHWQDFLKRYWFSGFCCPITGSIKTHNACNFILQKKRKWYWGNLVSKGSLGTEIGHISSRLSRNNW